MKLLGTTSVALLSLASLSSNLITAVSALPRSAAASTGGRLQHGKLSSRALSSRLPKRPAPATVDPMTLLPAPKGDVQFDSKNLGPPMDHIDEDAAPLTRFSQVPGSDQPTFDRSSIPAQNPQGRTPQEARPESESPQYQWTQRAITGEGTAQNQLPQNQSPPNQLPQSQPQDQIPQEQLPQEQPAQNPSLNAATTGNIFPPPASLEVLQGFNLPRTGERDLAGPSSASSLRAVTIGLGRQTYICRSDGSWKHYGANAGLYDASPLMLRPEATPADMYLWPGQMLALEAAKKPVPLLPLGQHYYSGRGVPEFNLGDMGYFRGRPVQQIPAPAWSGGAVGGEGAGAAGPRTPAASANGDITWAHLRPTPGGRTANVMFKEVYRVVTAGGKAPAGRGRCNPRGGESQKLLHVPYSALYWLYV